MAAVYLEGNGSAFASGPVTSRLPQQYMATLAKRNYHTS
jgi:hypothetical protein